MCVRDNSCAKGLIKPNEIILYCVQVEKTQRYLMILYFPNTFVIDKHYHFSDSITSLLVTPEEGGLCALHAHRKLLKTSQRGLFSFPSVYL